MPPINDSSLRVNRGKPDTARVRAAVARIRYRRGAGEQEIAGRGINQIICDDQRAANGREMPADVPGDIRKVRTVFIFLQRGLHR